MWRGLKEEKEGSNVQIFIINTVTYGNEISSTVSKVIVQNF